MGLPASSGGGYTGNEVGWPVAPQHIPGAGLSADRGEKSSTLVVGDVVVYLPPRRDTVEFPLCSAKPVVVTAETGPVEPAHRASFGV